MTFTYDSSSLTTAVAKIRLELGDTRELAGLRPDGENFSDEELTFFYGDEDSSVIQAVARCCEVLSREYAAYAGFQALSESSGEYNRKSEQFAKRAAEIREQTGDAFGIDDPQAGGRVASSSPSTRVDGYSSTINSKDV